MIRNFDWQQTALGDPDSWPKSLRTTIGLLLHSAFPNFLFWGRDLLCFYNDAFRPSLGVEGKHPAVGKKAVEVWPEIWDFIGPLIEKVMTTGEPVYFEDQLVPFYRNGKVEDIYWTFSYSPAYGDDGEVAGVFVTCTETTDKVVTIQNLKESETRFRALVEEAPVATCLFTGPEMKVEMINDIMIGYWGKGRDVLGKPLEEALPELKGQPFLKLLEEVYTTGKTFEAKGALVELEVDGVLGEYYYDFTYKALRDSSGKIFGIINVSINATERILAQRKLESSQQQLLTYFEQSPVAIATISKEGLTFRMANPFYGELVGRHPQELINKPLLEALPELKGQGFDLLLEGVISSGIAYVANEVRVEILRNNQLETIYVNLTYQPERDEKDAVTGILVVATEVTLQVNARMKIEETEAALRGAVELADLGTWTIDLKARMLDYDQRLRSWFGFSEQEAITVEKAYAPISEADRPAIAAAILHCITPGTDGIYNVEYAIRNLVTGVERMVHAQGKCFFDEKGEAYKISGTAQDVTRERRTEAELTGLVQQRTEELAASNEELQATNEEIAKTNKELEEVNHNLQLSNAELEQFAYIASHDLQEPIRKISTFTQMLEHSLPEINLRARNYLDKINVSARRMTVLIRDVLSYSQASQVAEGFQQVDLNAIIRDIKTDFELLIEQKQADFESENLPQIRAVPLQMTQLFSNLVSNALKYSSTERRPRILITVSTSSVAELKRHEQLDPAKKYIHIIFSDNGIGFSQEHADTIFKIFQRLHGKTEFEGTGIGLSICRRIVQNHHGDIRATSSIDGGAQFHILLPVA